MEARNCLISVYVDKATLAKIDNVRGKISRSTFTAIVLDEVLAESEACVRQEVV
ncbi:MAG: hypothetical protein AAGU10_08380 [Methanosarcina mazei]